MQYSRQEQPKPFSPRVRWSIAGGLVIAVALLQYGIFRMGYNQGWKEGAATPPTYVVKQSDEKAMETLSRFMAESASGPDALAALVADRKNRLAWIRNDDLRADVSWGLGRELMSLNRSGDAMEMVRELMQSAFAQGQHGKWAPRAEFVANVLMREGKAGEAASCYAMAAEGFDKAGDQGKKIACLEMQSNALSAANNNVQALAVLQSILDAAPRDGEESKLLQSRTLAGMGRLNRVMGKMDQAGVCFSKALELWPSGKDGGGEIMGSAKVCMGELFLEAGRRDEARNMFEQGLSALEGTKSDLPYILTALRGLARIDVEKGSLEQALSFLYQAEGLAKGQIARDDRFWPCLFDQRGWVHLMRGKPEEAIKDFKRSEGTVSSPESRMQSCEGLGSAYMEKGSAEKALSCLKQSEELRLKYFPNDFAALARLYKKLGGAFDLAGDSANAVVAYGKAVDYLKKAKTDAKSPQWVDTVLCLAYASMDLKEWQKALDVFDLVLPSLEGERKSETLKNQAKCYDALNMKEKGDECWKAAGYPRISPPVKRGSR